MVYVDEPIGTGFSYSSQDFSFNLDNVSDYCWEFLVNYFTVFPEDLDNDIYLAGESYAGQYIPDFAHAIATRNSKLAKGQKAYNSKRLLIGNGSVE
ncbi:uncharacterized protein LODBEIA_P58360 [Lodderomyces beijingensis]|uniref:Carboxypeptidase n=1 Tax=Lodderomyces beijingensis TaxID=1775926 RepID=A0ABP0ZWN5_9ASCO